MPTFYINKLSTTIVCPTLVEKTTITTPVYIWEVINDSTLQKDYFSCTEESTELQRYNQFSIIETTTPDPFAGEVELTEGAYTYNIYEISSTDYSNIVDLYLVDYTALDVVEQGMLKCVDSSNNTNTEYPATVTNTEYN